MKNRPVFFIADRTFESSFSSGFAVVALVWLVLLADEVDLIVRFVTGLGEGFASGFGVSDSVTFGLSAALLPSSVDGTVSAFSLASVVVGIALSEAATGETSVLGCVASTVGEIATVVVLDACRIET